MFQVSDLSPYSDADTQGGEVFLEGRKTPSYYFPEQVDLMQFTGLHDKYGNEIYEGDIVRAHYYATTVPTIVSQESLVGSVRFNEKHAAFVIDSPADDILRDVPPPLDTEVLGNIYEHPDLLKEANAPRT